MWWVREALTQEQTQGPDLWVDIPGLQGPRAVMEDGINGCLPTG